MSRIQGPICGFTRPCSVEDGTMARAASPIPKPLGETTTTPAPARSQPSAFVGGSPLAEAKSLLRPSLPHGHYGSPLAQLPLPLEQIIGQEVKIAQGLITKYLRRANIREVDLGGLLTTKLLAARYLVIHDTSSALQATVRSFPRGINDSSWEKNRETSLRQRNNAHVFISRVGTSHTARDFSVPYSATKYTMHQTNALKLKFCHVELIQPRLVDHGSDWKAPEPGFPAAQLERLALVYIAASVRHGAWLIPVYHHNVDMGFPAHDDPQNFDLAEWADTLASVLAKIEGILPRGDFPTRLDSDRQA
jgi:hypothetical protein